MMAGWYTVHEHDSHIVAEMYIGTTDHPARCIYLIYIHKVVHKHEGTFNTFS